MADYYNYEKQEKRRGGGSGWMIATLLLAAFIAGALLMRLVPGKGSNGLLSAKTVSPTPTATAAVLASAPTQNNPAATLPPLGDNPAALSGDINIPNIVKADGPAVVGVLNNVRTLSQQKLDSSETQGSGSGVIISSDGYIVTNNHVIQGADSVSVVMQGGETVPAKVIGADSQTDLAVLKIDKSGLTTMKLGDSDAVQVGQSVVAIGNPLGTDLAGTVTSGIISAKDRELLIDDVRFKLLQTDAAINPGNSGGALVNSNGELIGINSLKSTSAGTDEYGNPISAEGIGFAIPINDARPIIEELITHGYVERPMMGISGSAITQEQASYNNVPLGLRVLDLSPNGPAAKAGVQAEDIITEIDGAKVTGFTDLRDAIDKHKVGDTVTLKVYRYLEQKEYTFQVTLASSGSLQQQQ